MADATYRGEPLPKIDETEQQSEDGCAQADPIWLAYSIAEQRERALHAAMNPVLSEPGIPRSIDDVLADASKILAFMNGEATNG